MTQDAWFAVAANNLGEGVGGGSGGGISKKRDFGGGCNNIARGCVVHVFQGGIAMLLLCFQGGVATLLICLRVKQTMRRQNALGRHRIHIKAANAQVLVAAALQRKPGMQTILEALQVYRTACSKGIVQTSPAATMADMSLKHEVAADGETELYIYIYGGFLKFGYPKSSILI